jgi:UPF0716 protein FxsA
VWRRFNQQIANGAVPSREIADGALLLVGGALLLTPGFLTDVIGLLAMFPPTRAVFRRLLMRRMRIATPASSGRTHATWDSRRGPYIDVDGQADPDASER